MVLSTFSPQRGGNASLGSQALLCCYVLFPTTVVHFFVTVFIQLFFVCYCGKLWFGLNCGSLFCYRLSFITMSITMFYYQSMLVCVTIYSRILCILVTLYASLTPAQSSGVRQLGDAPHQLPGDPSEAEQHHRGDNLRPEPVREERPGRLCRPDGALR